MRNSELDGAISDLLALGHVFIEFLAFILSHLFRDLLDPLLRHIRLPRVLTARCQFRLQLL